MFHKMKLSLLRFMVTRIQVNTYERLLTHSVLKESFSGLARVNRIFDGREELWNECLSRFHGDPITYVEFGVHTGHSIKFFAQGNANPQSIFIGLDSFEGLPENWGAMPKGTFDVNGEIPEINDRRVCFIKGLFQNTWPQLYSRLQLRNDNLIVHFDADLYSSTLFALSKMDTVGAGYIAIFDEFPHHEVRALYNYTQSHRADVNFLGKTVANKYPVHVMCRITPTQALV